ncbi:MAG: ATP-dependent DNA helicase RecG [Chloroflexota bacterium]|nr:ATP-dependent DNA helicase RecG [Chloroflexota bacterium]MDE2893893.1 ATP-dependent DNA helicase RecG [Chloroflexota bacterium]
MTSQRRPTQTLQSMLALEEKLGYEDRAVAGGLDGFLRNVLKDGEQAQFFTQIVAALPQDGYASLTPDQRKRWAADVRAALRPGAAPGSFKRSDRTRNGRTTTQPASNDPDQSQHNLDKSGQIRTPKRTKSSRRRPPATFDDENPLARDVSVLGRIPPISRKAMTSIGLETVYDLLWHLPRRYEDWRNVRTISEALEGIELTIVAEIASIGVKYLRGGRTATEAVVRDGTGSLRIWWWQQPYLARSLKAGMRVGLSGTVEIQGRRLRMVSPEWERLDDPDDDTVHVGRLSPVYPRTKGLPNRTIRRLAHRAVRDYLPLLAESLPPQIIAEQGYQSEAEALATIHFPDRLEDVELAKERIAFQELLSIQLAVLSRKREARLRADAPPIPMPGDFLDRFIGALPFELTAAQQRVLTEIRNDMFRREPMARLLQGDVGSGKTVVAAAAMLAAVRAGHQTVLMAPTEVLASQHYETFQRLFAGDDHTGGEQLWYNFSLAPALGRPVRMALLTGSVRAARKRQIHQEMASGMLDLVVGTHALIQESANFNDLGLAVVDEQHRFGVLQRDALRSKGRSPHLLVMTATPIPRTLALTIYGELDNSVIDELPPGRQRVRTQIVEPSQREEIVYQRIREEAAQGRQTFVICPLIDESDKLEAEAATEQYEFLRSGPLRELAPRIRLLHGRMSADEKRSVMADLARGDADVLVSTIVVEVGVDLPRATVMVIEGAERFGLAQLHQLRGRVGRSDLPSVCYLISETDVEQSQRRLDLMVQTTNGFELAEADLEMRGPGEYFGTRQSGLPELRVAKLTDHRTLNLARNWANRILDGDPHLRAPEHRLLRARADSLNVAGATAVH